MGSELVRLAKKQAGARLTAEWIGVHAVEVEKLSFKRGAVSGSLKVTYKRATLMSNFQSLD